jgi:uncharacterized protein (DUF1810 family)
VREKSDSEVTDPYNLQRFLDAQDPVYDSVCAELREGEKRSHWMWFIFPQIKGLGHSPMANKFAISSQQEAEAYLGHPVLNARLRECARLVNLVDGKSIAEILGYPDDLKFRSSMTLFAYATRDDQVFKDALKKYFRGEFDRPTLSILKLPVGNN